MFERFQDIESMHTNSVDSDICKDETKETIFRNFGINDNDIAWKVRRFGMERLKKLVVSDRLQTMNLNVEKIINNPLF